MRGDKFQRAIQRLYRGDRLYRLPSGQWKFGGNKFVPDSVAQSLPLLELGATNRGWFAYILDPKFQSKGRQ